jgi:imidazolonepropionase-like amidohydrolase
VETTAFFAPRAWLGPGQVVDRVAVLVTGGVIEYAGVEERLPDHDGPTVDVDGFLIPAPADRHVHVGLSDPAAILLGGVTAVRDLAWPEDVILPLAEASEGPAFNGPLIRAAGPMLTAPGGYPTRAGWGPPGTGLELAMPEQAAHEVHRLADRGAAHIKVSLNSVAGPTPDDAVLLAIVAAARLRRIPVTAHVQGRGQADRALGAGISEIAHTPWTDRLADDLLGSMARAGMRIVSTLDIHGWGEDTTEVRTALDNLRRFHAAGGEVLYGTDLGNGDVPPGIDVREVGLLQEAGIVGDALMRAVTRAPLSAGAPADLVGLGSDPFEDPSAWSDVRLVTRGGRVVVG